MFVSHGLVVRLNSHHYHVFHASFMARKCHSNHSQHPQHLIPFQVLTHVTTSPCISVTCRLPAIERQPSDWVNVSPLIQTICLRAGEAR